MNKITLKAENLHRLKYRYVSMALWLHSSIYSLSKSKQLLNVFRKWQIKGAFGGWQCVLDCSTQQVSEVSGNCVCLPGSVLQVESVGVF